MLVNDPNEYFNWYLKEDMPAGSSEYTAYFSGGCIGGNELGVTEQTTVCDCAALCNADE